MVCGRKLVVVMTVTMQWLLFLVFFVAICEGIDARVIERKKIDAFLDKHVF